MKKDQILVVILLYFAALGGLAAYLEMQGVREPQWSVMLTSIGGSLLLFWWYWSDSELRSYRRTVLLNAAVIGIGFLAIPYYLLRSREKGQRLLSLAKMLGFVLLMVVAVVLGALPFELLG